MLTRREIPSLPCKSLINMVGTTGFEPATSFVSRKRSNQLSYAPAMQLQVVYQEPGGGKSQAGNARHAVPSLFVVLEPLCQTLDRKSTRLNSSHLGISYAV